MANLKRMWEHTGTERDCWIIIVSKEGEGKSTLAQLIGMAWIAISGNKALFSLDNNVYFIPDLEDRMKTRPKRSCIISDEGSQMFMRADAMTKEGKQRLKLAWKIRSQCHLHVVLLTESAFARVDPILLQDRVKALIRVPKRGRLHWFSKRKLLNIQVDEKEKIVKRWGKANWTGSFRKLPEKSYEEYDAHKSKQLGTNEAEDLSVPKGKYYTVGQAAKQWLVSVQTSIRWCDNGKVKAIKNALGTWRIPESEVKRLLPRPPDEVVLV